MNEKKYIQHYMKYILSLNGAFRDIAVEIDKLNLSFESKKLFFDEILKHIMR